MQVSKISDDFFQINLTGDEMRVLQGCVREALELGFDQQRLALKRLWLVQPRRQPVPPASISTA